MDGFDIQEVEKFIEGLENAFQPLFEIFSPDTKSLMRTPVEIKKDIKHKKNPMRLKQLNRELNDSYKAFRFRKGGNNG